MRPAVGARRCAALLPLIMLLACDGGSGAAGLEPPPRELTAIDRTLITGQIERLAHDSLAGRGSGTADERRAADYIAAEFAHAGLEPAAEYLVHFTVDPARVGGRVDVSSQNVIGIIPGTGNLRNEWIVLGAHYDHIGSRLDWSGVLEVYNGADDNASGTALLIETARFISAYFASGGAGTRARRSIMFQAFGAEELGLLGSEHYCAHPTAALPAVIAMLNFDMVGRMTAQVLRIGGTATSADWSGLIAEHNRNGLIIVAADCAACSDHVCFRRHERPVLWFSTGLHSDYHQTTDDAGRINAEGIGQIADLAVRLTVDLALRARAPAFLPQN